jgi:hypothetical protein
MIKTVTEILHMGLKLGVSHKASTYVIRTEELSGLNFFFFFFFFLRPQLPKHVRGG